MILARRQTKRKAWEAFFMDQSDGETIEPNNKTVKFEAYEPLKEEPFCDSEGNTNSPCVSDDEGFDDYSFGDDEEYSYEDEEYNNGRYGGGGEGSEKDITKGEESWKYTSKLVRQQMTIVG